MSWPKNNHFFYLLIAPLPHPSSDKNFPFWTTTQSLLLIVKSVATQSVNFLIRPNRSSNLLSWISLLRSLLEKEGHLDFKGYFLLRLISVYSHVVWQSLPFSFFVSTLVSICKSFIWSQDLFIMFLILSISQIHSVAYLKNCPSILLPEECKDLGGERNWE